MEESAVQQVREENRKLTADIQALTRRVKELEERLLATSPPLPVTARRGEQLSSLKTAERSCEVTGGRERQCGTGGWKGVDHTLSKAQLERYSRQILLGSFGVQAQDRLYNSSVLIVGAGGLGCPAAIYLAAAGVGKIGIVDKDVVDTSNLHRQILHREDSVGTHKALSAAAACHAINSTIQVVPHTEGFFPANALELVRQYDVVVDASDNVPTRYLTSDACCVLQKPLISGAAIGTDGQLAVYCHNGGPCYRCLFPTPPAAENCTRCSEAGVLGPVPGVIGTLQALEAIKILSGKGTVMSQRLLIADFLSGRFTTVKLRTRQPDCRACGTQPEVTLEGLPSFDYAAFAGQNYDDRGESEVRLLPEEQRVSAQGLAAKLAQGERVIDVRPYLQFQAAHLPGAVHVPFDEHQPQKFAEAAERALREDASLSDSSSLTVVCRRGNDSQRAVQLLRERLQCPVVDLQGGLLRWSSTADPAFPSI